MNIIYWEVLQGVIDWSNATFSVQKDITTIVEINIWGLPTTSYTQDGRKIIFDTAPLDWTESPTIDYYWEEVCSFSWEDITLWDVLIDVKDVIWITRFSTPYPEVSAIKKIDEAYKQIKNWEGMQIKGSLSFTKWGTYSYWEFERLDLVKTSSTIDNYTPRVWRMMVANSIVQYSTRTDSSFTLTEPTTFTPETNDRIVPWYKLPSCIRSVTEVMVNNKGASEITFSDWNSNNTSGVYTIVDWYIYLWQAIDSVNVVIKYITNNTSFTDSADVVDIPSEFSSVLSDYASWNMLQNREDERWQWVRERHIINKRKWKAYEKRQKHWANDKPFFDWPLNVI